MVQADSPSHWLPCTTPSTKHTESVVRSTACLRVVLGHMLVSIPKGETFFLVTTGRCPDLPNAHMLEFDGCLLGRPAPWELSPNAKTAPFWVSRLQDAGTWAMGNVHGIQEILEDWQRTQQDVSLLAVNLQSKHSLYEPSSPETMYRH